MTIEIPQIEKDYFLMLNYPELVERAWKMGFEKPLLVQKELDVEDIEKIKVTGKSIAFYYYSEDNIKPKWIENIRQKLKDAEIKYSIDSADNWITYDGDITSLEENLACFPTIEQYESHLMSRGTILSKDYTNRCGNCHAYLRDGDKYCRICRTERGKGKFEPYKNTSYCVYGPQVKIKYQCEECGNIWIVGALGGDYSYYCPKCGRKKITLLQEEVCDFDLFGYVGIKEPFEENKRPRLLSEDQIKALISNKRQKDAISPLGLAELMEASGIEGMELLKDENADQDLTEEEGERLNLIVRIQLMTGTNPKGYKGVSCPNCKSECLGAIGYSIWTDNHKKLLDSNVCVAGGTKDAIVYPLGDGWNYREDVPGPEHPAYICLSCGKRFGTFRIPQKWEQDYRVKNAAENVARTARDIGNATINFGTAAGEAAKSLFDMGVKAFTGFKKTKDSEKNNTDETGNEQEITEQVKTEAPQPDKNVYSILNTVIEGAYSFSKIEDKRGKLFIGEKEISRINCESYEENFSSEVVEETKAIFSEFRNRSFNPLKRMLNEKYLMIVWRNGEKSIVCADWTKYLQIVKILS